MLPWDLHESASDSWRPGEAKITGAPKLSTRCGPISLDLFIVDLINKSTSPPGRSKFPAQRVVILNSRALHGIYDLDPGNFLHFFLVHPSWDELKS